MKTVYDALKSVLKLDYKAEPVLLLGVVGIAANTAYDAVRSGADIATAVETIAIALGAFAARSRVKPDDGLVG